MKKVNNDDFDLVNLPEACNDPEIKQEDFVLTNADTSVHEQKFQTRPTTFLKDSLKRFRKNKSSVVAAYILGALMLLAIFVPIISPYDVSKSNDTAFYNLEPKLFNNGGFWDGTVKVNHEPVDSSSSDKKDWLPNPVYYKKDGISSYQLTAEEYTNESNNYARLGYVQIGYYGTYGNDEAHVSSMVSNDSKLGDSKVNVLDLSVLDLFVTKFESVDEEKIRAYASEDASSPELPENVLPEGFELGDLSLDFVYFLDGEVEEHRVTVIDKNRIHNIGSTLPVSGTDAVDIGSIIKAESGLTTFKSFYFDMVVSKPTTLSEDESVCSLVKCLEIQATSLTADPVPADVDLYLNGGVVKYIELPGVSFDDANEFVCRESKKTNGSTTVQNIGYWSIENLQKFVKSGYLCRCIYANFIYDTYKGSLGRVDMILSSTKLENYRELGWINFEIIVAPNAYGVVEVVYFEDPEIIDTTHCPIIAPFTIDDVIPSQIEIGGEYTYSVAVEVYNYKYLGYTEMPKFLFGTDKTGRDMFKYVFEGLRNSLLLGLFTFVVCFIFGLAYGAVSGYFGGTVDLVLERITDILAGVPWIVVMTLVILKTDESSFWTFALALCLTGWIGTAATTRTQFYRFRGREYVLASRTLGASDARLIAKHILPNAMGTIITSSVLMIPSVIFSEATISYLGLGFKNLSSLGVILSNNQDELTKHPYQLIFPSVVIALVMISFNLFGNGLRDAINPSLKGEDE